MSAVSIFCGSVYGGAQYVAEEAQRFFESQNVISQLLQEPSVDDLVNAERVLVVTSTTGQGEVPPNLEWWVDDVRNQKPPLNGKPFAVVSLGDSSYGETYCGSGRQIFALLEELNGKPLLPALEVDAIETLEPENELLAWLEENKDKLL